MPKPRKNYRGYNDHDEALRSSGEDLKCCLG